MSSGAGFGKKIQPPTLHWTAPGCGCQKQRVPVTSPPACQACRTPLPVRACWYPI